MEIGDIELCGSTIAVVLQPSGPGNNYDGNKVFLDFVKENSQCLWKPELVKSMSTLRYSGNLLDPFTILMRGNRGSLQNIREAWSTRTLRPPHGFHIQVVGDVNRIRAHPLSRGHFILLKEAVCVAIDNLSSQNIEATQSEILHEIALTFGDGKSNAHIPSEELLHETLGKLIRDRIVFCTGVGYHLVKQNTYCVQKLAKRPTTPKKLKKTKTCCCAQCQFSPGKKHVMIDRSKSERMHRHEAINITKSKSTDHKVQPRTTSPNAKPNKVSKHEKENTCQCLRSCEYPVPQEMLLLNKNDQSSHMEQSIVDKFTSVLFKKKKSIGKADKDSKKQNEECVENRIEKLTIKENEKQCLSEKKHRNKHQSNPKSGESVLCEQCETAIRIKNNQKRHTNCHDSSKHRHKEKSIQRVSPIKQLHGVSQESAMVSKELLHSNKTHQQEIRISSQNKHSSGLKRSKSLKLPREKKYNSLNHSLVDQCISDMPQRRNLSSDNPPYHHTPPVLTPTEIFEQAGWRASVASSTKREYSFLHASPNAPAFRIGSAIAGYLNETNRREELHKENSGRLSVSTVQSFRTTSSNEDRSKVNTESKEIQCNVDNDLPTELQNVENDDEETRAALNLAKELAKQGIMMTREEWKEYFTTKRLPVYVWEKLKRSTPSPVEVSGTYFDTAGSLETVINCGSKNDKITLHGKVNSTENDSEVSSYFAKRKTPTKSLQHSLYHEKFHHDIDCLTEDSGFNSSREVSDLTKCNQLVQCGSMV